MTNPRQCQIVPPYLLEAIAHSHDHVAVERARESLVTDDVLRAQRLVQVQTVLAAATPPGEPHVQRLISDAQHTQTLPGKRRRGEGEGPVHDVAVNEAYDGLGATWTLYWQAFGRNSLDGSGLTLPATVHYGAGYDNAFWDGQRMVFGDGDGRIFNRFTVSVDVIGHELTHGVTQVTAGLLYNGQSGALNESLSDVFGSLVKQHALGQSANDADWLIGQGLFTSRVKGRALRDMLNPGTAYDDPTLGKDPQPATMAGYVKTTADNGGVHVNSGIPNRAFALAARAIGGFAWEGAGAIWYAVLTGGAIPARCDFATFAALTITEASRAHGVDSPQHEAVAQAWTTVGVTPSGALPGTPAEADPGTLAVTRSGGFTGLMKSRTAALDTLPHKDAEAWRTLLEGDQLAQFTEIPGHPDAFQYTVCANGEVLCASDNALPSRIVHLIERFLDEAPGAP